MPFNAVIFDFDGTLVPTMRIFADVASRLISQYYGLEIEKAKEKYFETSGYPFRQQLEIIFPESLLNDKVAQIYEKQKLVETADINIDPDDLAALKKLKNYGCKLAVSSNNYQHNVSNFILKNKIEDIFDAALGFRDGFGKGKPHFDFIMDKLHLHRGETLFIGDSINDARLAKMNSINFMARLGTFKEDDFKKFDKNIKCVADINGLVRIICPV